MLELGNAVVFPLYLVVIPSKGNAPIACVSEEKDAEEIRSVAMFTEELLAERSRDR
jgi:hypothetical protein